MIRKTMFLLIAVISIVYSDSWAISWQNDMTLAIEKAKSEGKPVMADLYTSWCGWCKKLDKDVYEDPEVNTLSERFVCVKVDCGIHKDASIKYGVRGYPTIVFFNSDGGVEETVVGYRGAQAFAEIMKKVIYKIPKPEIRQVQSANEPVIKKHITEGEFELTGIMGSKAIINDVTVSVGDNINGAKIIEITSERVRLLYKDKEITLSLAGSSGTDSHRSMDIVAREAASYDDREKRFKGYSEWIKETAGNKSKVNEKGEVAIKRDPQSHSVLVEAVLNDGTKAILIVDTGADMVVLSKRIGEKLGVDVSTDTGNDIAEMRLAGGKSAKVRMTILKRVSIEAVEEKDVKAAVLLEDEDGSGFKDGLLGRSFLNRYNISIDLQKMKMLMEKIK